MATMTAARYKAEAEGNAKAKAGAGAGTKAESKTKAEYDAFLSACPSRKLLDRISDKWVTLVLAALGLGMFLGLIALT